ncbi:MAG: hypothetical protein FWE07_02930 [Turicibacter sp.]|nr:hypothetical protein [Turicibacter sp.]
MKLSVKEKLVLFGFLLTAVSVLIIMFIFSLDTTLQHNELMLMSLDADNNPVYLIDELLLDEIEGNIPSLSSLTVLIGESSSSLTTRFMDNVSEILMHNSEVLIFFIDVDLEDIDSSRFRLVMDGFNIRGLPVLVFLDPEEGLFHHYYFDGYEVCQIVEWIHEVNLLTRNEIENWAFWWEEQMCSE